MLVGVAADRLPPWTRAQPTRVLGWIVAVGLLAYGGVLTTVGLLVEVSVVKAAHDADEHALAWHTYFWDPWFTLWGGASTFAMWRSRPQLGS